MAMKQRSCDIKTKKRLKYERCHSYAVFVSFCNYVLQRFCNYVAGKKIISSELLD